MINDSRHEPPLNKRRLFYSKILLSAYSLFFRKQYPYYAAAPRKRMDHMHSKAPAQNASAAQDKPDSSFYYKLFLLYLLNIIDWLCTETLLQSGRFTEINPLMKPFVGGFWSVVIIKGIVPLALVIFCAVVYKLSGSPKSSLVNSILKFWIFIYFAIILWHIFNFVLLFFVF